MLDRRKKGLLGCFSDTQPSPCTRHGDLDLDDDDEEKEEEEEDDNDKDYKEDTS